MLQQFGLRGALKRSIRIGALCYQVAHPVQTQRPIQVHT
jgi:hypothetical protein